MKARFSVHVLLCLLILLTVSAAANAQATRTWVSGVGDDANPCSRTAPCKTFAGAISKTAAGGEINVLDPGGFGAVTITKSITISSEGFEAGVLVSGTNGIVISAGINDVIVLRGLDIEGLGTGLAGIKFLAGHALHVEKCTINHFTQLGIDFVPTAASASTSHLYVSNSIIRNNTGASSGGIRVKPGANVSVIGSIDDTELRNNQFGLRTEDNSTVTAKNTIATGNIGNGFIAVSVGSPTNLNLDACVASSNTLAGVKSDNNTNATVRLAHCMIVNNAGGGLVSGGGKTISFTGTNFIDNGSPTGPNIAPQ